MSLIDEKFISLVSSRLDKYKRLKSGLYTFRCPYCGDSQKYKNKTRGYLYVVKNDYNFKCHNCGYSRSFTNSISCSTTITDLSADNFLRISTVCLLSLEVIPAAGSSINNSFGS